jgi:hypothetical protein
MSTSGQMPKRADRTLDPDHSWDRSTPRDPLDAVRTWMTIFLPRISWPSALSSSRVANTVPRPVAASRPHDPCRYTGLPVTTAGENPGNHRNRNRNWNRHTEIEHQRDY